MKLTKYAGLIVTLTGLTAPAVSGERLSTTIRVLDQADIGVSRIHKMERYVENSLAAIEIDVKWVDCATNLKVCQSKRGPNEFWLRILAQMPPRNGIAGTDTLGFTQRGEPGSDGIQCVSIFYPMVEQLSDRVAVDSHQILGAAVVHEIGHLYLGANSEAHSRTGVMCGVWSHPEFEQLSIGQLNFARDQAARIRAAIRAQPHKFP